MAICERQKQETNPVLTESIKSFSVFSTPLAGVSFQFTFRQYASLKLPKLKMQSKEQDREMMEKLQINPVSCIVKMKAFHWNTIQLLGKLLSHFFKHELKHPAPKHHNGRRFASWCSGVVENSATGRALAARPRSKNAWKRMLISGYKKEKQTKARIHQCCKTLSNT